jgi:hypothetical protein
MLRRKEVSQDASVTGLKDAFAAVERFTILGRGPSAVDERGRSLPSRGVLVTGPTYATRDVFAGEPVGVLIGTPPDQVEAIARRFHDTPIPRRPVLMYTFLSAVPSCDFEQFDLNPIPIGPLLRNGGFEHFDASVYPTSGVFQTMLAASLGKGADVAGIDLYRHTSGRTYVDDTQETPSFVWPKYHSLNCDLRHLRQVAGRLQGKLNLSPELSRALETA